MENNCLWLAKGKVNYYTISVLNKLSTAFYSLAICALVLEIFLIFFFCFLFPEFKAVSVGQISKKF